MRRLGIDILAHSLLVSGSASLLLAAPSTPAVPPAPPIVVSQVPPGFAGAGLGPGAGALRSDAADGGRLILVTAGLPAKHLTLDFASATDADVSFDGKRILFAAKRAPSDPWCIFEMQSDGTDARKLTCGPGEARHPIYISTVHTLTAKVTEPWIQFAFVGFRRGQTAEDGVTSAANIYTCKFDGSALHPIGFSLSHETDPVILPDGRLVYSVWRAHRLAVASRPRTELLSMNLDGSDPLGYVTSEGRGVKQMPAVAGSNLLVFVEFGESGNQVMP